MSIHVRYQASYGRQFGDGSTHYDGTQLVRHALESASILSTGDQAHVDQFDRLVEIVGRLLERMPHDAWIEICGLEYELEEV